MKAPERQVWILWHVPPGGDADKSVLIGAYSSKKSALAAVTRLVERPGFRDHPTIVGDSDGPGFFMEPYELDLDHWTDGYRVERDGDDWQPVPAWLGEPDRE